MVWLYQLQQRLSITQNETWAILTLSMLFLVGTGVRFVQQRQLPPLTSPSLLAVADTLDSDSLSADTTNVVTLDSAQTDTTAVAEASGEADTADAAGGVINVNTASATQLQALPGIGPALSGRIIDYRTTHGPFPTADALQDVSGIGPKTLERLRPLVTVE